MKQYVVVECGQRWWRPSSWRRPLSRKLIHYDGEHVGWAFGPIMFFKDGLS